MDEEKFKLIEFYKHNPELWVTNQGISRSQRALKKVELFHAFEGKFQIDWLEKTFHGLRSSFLREFKKTKEEKYSKKPWKFYKSMLFLKEEQIAAMKRAVFSMEERAILITFYRVNPALWNYRLDEYSDQNIRRLLIHKLVKQFDDKFTEGDIKWEWSRLLSRYKRVKQCQVTFTSGTPTDTNTDVIFNPNWEHYEEMIFLEETTQKEEEQEEEEVESTNTSNEEEILPAPTTKRIKFSKEADPIDHPNTCLLYTSPSPRDS